MIKIYIKIFLIFLLIALNNCSKKEIEKNENINNTKNKPELLYKKAMQELNKEKYEDAKVKFENISFLFPLSNESIQSQLMIGFIHYANLDYDDAINKFNKIIKLYPSHKNIDYAYYMRAISYFEQIVNEELDGMKNQEALINFQQIINRFPNSKYSRDSQQKIVLVKENIAAKHMNIGFFYLKEKKFLAALNRYKVVVENFSESKFTPEALYRLVEIYYSLGLKEDAKKTASIIAFNYPKSKWYKYSYDLIKDKKKKKSTILDKFANILRKNDNTE